MTAAHTLTGSILKILILSEPSEVSTTILPVPVRPAIHSV